MATMEDRQGTAGAVTMPMMSWEQKLRGGCGGDSRGQWGNDDGGRGQ